MNKNNKYIKDEYIHGKGKVRKFKNIFAFMNYCKANVLTPNNSITYYDEEEQAMYIKGNNVTWC